MTSNLFMSMLIDMNKRPYSSPKRAEAAAATRSRVLEATIALGAAKRIADTSLEDVASAAGVTVKTVLRQFGSRADLFAEASATVRSRIVAERRAPTEALPDAMKALLDHYEADGAMALRLLAQEDDDPLVASITAQGKELHRQWVTEVFAGALRSAPQREELINLLVVATDVYTWKLLRLDRHLSRARTQAHMTRLVSALLTD